MMMYTFGMGLALLLMKPLHAMTTMEDAEFDGVCTEDGCHKQHGEALVQVRQTIMFKQGHEKLASRASSCCCQQTISDQPQVGGNTASLDEQGFNAVRKLCCSSEMATFMRRFFESKGFSICHAGALMGTAVHYDCKDDPSDWIAMQTVALPTSSAIKGDCPWLAPPGGCAPMPPTCPSFPEAECEPCKNTVCCGITNRYKATHKTITSTSKIQKFDCVKSPFPIQVYADSKLKGEYQVASLDVTTGKYTLLFKIMLSQPGYKISNVNSVAINPVDGLAYGTFKVDKVNYIARFDAANIEFVAKFSWETFSKKKEKDTMYLGAFGFSGTYYVAGKSTSDPGQEVLSFKDIVNVVGFASPSDKKLMVLTTKSPGISYSHVQGGSSDLVIATGNFDEAGEAEWMFLLANSMKLSLLKIPDSDLSKHTLYKMQPDPEHIPKGAAKSAGFGAAWSFQNQVYFGRNNGDGVFEIKTENIDLAKKTFKFSLHKVSVSVMTAQNDGMNCLDARPPFPGECTLPQFEVPKVKGSCPAGAIEVPMSD
jgi:hypothetical protein